MRGLRLHQHVHSLKNLKKTEAYKISDSKDDDVGDENLDEAVDENISDLNNETKSNEPLQDGSYLYEISPFECQFCDKKFKDELSKEKHESSHEDLKKSRQNNEANFDAEAIQIHDIVEGDMDVQIAPNESNCVDDDEIVKNELDKKKQKNRKTLDFPCKFCELKYKYLCNLTRHVKSKHPEKKFETQKVPTEILEEKFVDSLMKRNSDIAKTIKFKVCVSLIDIVNHLRCANCLQHYASREILREHIKIHEIENQSEIDTTEFSVKSKQSLHGKVLDAFVNTSLSTTEKEDKMEANDIVDLTETPKNVLQEKSESHENKTNGNTNVECDVCLKKFHPKGIKRHRKSHSKENEEIFEPPEKTSDHQIPTFDSNDERKITCTLCEKKFVNKKAISVHHRRTHNIVKGNSFMPLIDSNEKQEADHQSANEKTDKIGSGIDTSIDSLESLIMKNGEEIGCESCDRVFTSRKALAGHKKAHLSSKATRGNGSEISSEINKEKDGQKDSKKRKAEDQAEEGPSLKRAFLNRESDDGSQNYRFNNMEVLQGHQTTEEEVFNCQSCKYVGKSARFLKIHQTKTHSDQFKKKMEDRKRKSSQIIPSEDVETVETRKMIDSMVEDFQLPESKKSKKSETKENLSSSLNSVLNDIMESSDSTKSTTNDTISREEQSLHLSFHDESTDRSNNASQSFNTTKNSKDLNSGNGRMESCQHCDFTSFHKTVLQVHMSQAHSKKVKKSSEDDAKEYQTVHEKTLCICCAHCKFSTESMEAMIKHNREKHSELKTK